MLKFVLGCSLFLFNVDIENIYIKFGPEKKSVQPLFERRGGVSGVGGRGKNI